MKKIISNLNYQHDNHILPFLWMKGEDEATIRAYIKKIHESGIGAVCLEARPHPEFVREGWWENLRVVIDELKKYEMKMWILDDAHFPTGYANGEIERKYPHLRKRYIKLHQLDFVGPMNHVRGLIKYAISSPEDEIVSVVLMKRVSYDEVDPSTAINITEDINHEMTVSFDLPEGQWRLMTVVATYEGGETHTENYLNPIDPKATDVLLEAVYEPHYEQFGELFGDTILGFFSDEPRFGNMHGPMGSIGRWDMVLPWRSDMIKLLSARFGSDTSDILGLLFIDGGNKAHELRYAYMDLISDLYAENFSNRIGLWCEAHNVEYIGHVIEDNNAHGRLGYGAGHFFRSMRGQHMAGIDVVLHQLLPGMDQGYFKSMTRTGWDGEFFHYALAKLGSSLAHMDKKKAGRVMCEVFGAYGWAEGTKLMKWITDHMLVRGVNYFTPHAFSMAPYPDKDCPPHFYAHGLNPQFEEFGLLMGYMNRMANLISGGRHQAPAAILYHGEAEWSGEYMLMQKPAAELTRHQIDFDFIACEMLEECAIREQGIRLQDETFKVLIVPYSEALPKRHIAELLRLAKGGVLIYFIDGYPKRYSEGMMDEAARFELTASCQIVTLDNLVPELGLQKISEISLSDSAPYLRYYHYEQEDGDIFMFFNEHHRWPVDTIISIPLVDQPYAYDAMGNKVSDIKYEVVGEGIQLPVALEPFETMTVIIPRKGHQDYVQVLPVPTDNYETVLVSGPFDVTFLSYDKDETYTKTIVTDTLKPLCQMAVDSSFSGIIRYVFDLDVPDSGLVELVLKGVPESAKITVGDVEIGTAISAPYKFNLSKAPKGMQKIIIEATTTLANNNLDWLSQFMVLEDQGIVGPIELRYS